MKKLIHPMAGALGFATIATFWVSTVLSELFGSHATVTAVKTTIPWGFLILVPALAMAGASGMSMAKGAKTGLVGTKAKRMPFIAGNGLLILIPSAFYLAAKASAGLFDTGFYVVQAIELVAGATNLTLLGLQMRDGFRLTGRIGRSTSFATRLVRREVVADGTVALWFEKPDGFVHEAGQAVTISLVAPAGMDAAGNSRMLTIASAPHEDTLMFATRLSGSAFKREIAGMPEGSTVRLSRPVGEMGLGSGTGPAVFIAGGIGITPFLSMIREAAHRGEHRPIALFYSNRSAASSAFVDELRDIAAADSNFRLVTVMSDTDAAAAGVAGSESGTIDEAMLRRHSIGFDAAIFYLAGSPAMVASLHSMLRRARIPEGSIVTDEFLGY